MPFPPNAARAPFPPSAAAPAAPSPSPGPQMTGAPAPGAQQSAFHMEVLRRLKMLPPPDQDALRRGISPEAAVVLIKLLPEIKQLIASVGAQPPMPAGGGPVDRPDVMRPGPDSVPPQFSQARPTTKLGQY